MDLYVFVSVLSVMYTCMLCTVLSAPAADSDSASDSASTSSTTNSALSHGTHVRNKRCSCATFLDKECVYFCHLDIIWVNTPERVVSYGLGNAPRRRRAASEPLAPRSPPRCQCFSRDDKNCRSFCGLDQSLRYETSPDTLIHLSARGHGCSEPQCKQELAGDTGEIRSNRKQASPAALASKTRLLLEKWLLRRRHRARAWEGKSPAS
ncbi:endothelin-1 isoform X2 [Cynoglossus semilaevis]|uniref:endothelin-1 isoform X2 n=1 Tax=Cynoglossus semilaevis TaxID=244447 RepID=UPI000D62E908|nr:endothelin-1 isoform X2 [Cynoglossus semilaevis]